MAATQKSSPRNIYLYAMTGLGIILFTFGAIRGIDTALRHVVFDLPVYHDNCESESKREWQWRWHDEHFFFEEFESQADEEAKKPSDEEIAAFQAEILSECETRVESQQTQWAASRYSTSLALAIAGLLLALPHSLLLRRKED